MVYSGNLKCYKNIKNSKGEKEDKFLLNYEIGGVFGELSLLYNTPRAANIVALTDSILFSLSRIVFNGIVKKKTIE